MKSCSSLAVICLLTAACSASSPAPASSTSPQSQVTEIKFETTACYGFCPVFTAEIGSDGSGQYEGYSFVAQNGPQAFTASSAEFAALETRLAPFRPEASVAYNAQNCGGPVATDNPSVKVTWVDAQGQSVSLDWYMGCRQPGLDENRAAIYDAWEEVPALAELVGQAESRQEYSRQGEDKVY